MRILGVDPGTVSLGFGVVDGEEDMRVVDCGVVSVSPRVPMEKRLCSLYERLGEIITEHSPGEAAIEDPFIGHNVRSAFALGRAQAIAILAAANLGLPVFYYSPATIKQQITGYGQSDKRQIQEMVRVHLGLSELPQPSDAADALAVAICHIQHSRVNRWLSEHIPR